MVQFILGIAIGSKVVLTLGTYHVCVFVDTYHP